jgi:energy-coupling factor transport system permease protein
VPPGAFLSLLRPVALVVALTVLFQVFFSREGRTLFEWGFLEVHSGGLWMGLFLALRILLLVSLAGLLTATTAPVALADGIEDLLSPLRKLRFPAHEVAMMMTIALRFIPTLHEEAQKITKAQAARGANFSDGGPIRRVRAMLPVLVPLTVGAFHRADELAEAMESRGYRGGEGRTRYRELRFRARDALALTAAALVLVAGILL